ncbi:alpha/beta fold hydrolase [Vibrio tritonius]|uniref:Alpha/beta fold hydrolase n=1 Tax=Vibrio tritonius TaxID=1435069 RepID=A0ABS7YIB2_9VIBR|nr:alpha/beta fold hydrolase [Vibrio tritonius]MCA2015416.1 alpha/beta fold hydrolase [Vibrio tritonius]
MSTTQTLYSFTQEDQFLARMNSEVADLWQQRNEGFYRAFDKKKVYWCSLTNPNHTKAIVMVNGRIESTWKYQELFFDLYQNGYDIYSFDHRGQGLSQRLIDNIEMGHVGEFNDYITDLIALLELFDLEKYQQRFLLGHSMGGAIATRYVQMTPQHPFHALAVTAPMFGVNMPWQLRPIAIPLTHVMTATSSTPKYAPGFAGYYAKPFDINPLTHSEVRYQWFRKLYEERPELKLGGPSTRWVWQGLIAAKQCLQLTRQVKLPTLVVQAEADTIVDNKAQTRFITKLAKTNTQCHIELIHGAKHELMFESDQYRNQVLTSILDFFQQVTSK